MNNSFRAVLYLLVGFATFAARAVTFTSDTTIDFANTNYDGSDIVISNCVVTIDGPHAFASLQVLGGGKLVHSGSDTGLLYSQFSTNEQPVLTSTNPVALNTTNIVLSSVVVTDLGGTTFYTNGVDYVLGVSSGVTSIVRTDASAIPDGATVSVTFSASVALGPSGLNLAIAGDALIEAGSAIALNGLGYTNSYGPGHGYAGFMTGSPAGSGGGHGGSGGASATAAPGGAAYDSVLQPTDKGSGGAAVAPAPGVAGGGAAQLNVGGLLRINGTLSANGASALTERAGGGAGGSFWLTAQTIAGSGSISVDGGDGESPAGGGGAGGRIAIYYQTNTFTGVLSARGGRGAQNGGAGTIYTKAGQAVGSALLDNAGRAGATTPLLTTEAFALTVRNGAMVSVANMQILGSLVLASNGWVTMNGPSGTLTVTGDITIPAGCGINVDGLGYGGASGPGAGTSYSSSGYTVGGGAGYGGGGAPVGSVPFSGPCYGSYTQPIDRGSGGGVGSGSPSYNLGGAGGGRVFLVVNGTLTLNGSISANGSAGLSQDSGGGSGGSIWLQLGTFAGAGALSANGGAGNDLGGGGGGGRIAVYYTNSSFAGSIKATGGGSGTKVGGAGTIYTKAAGQPAGQLLLDNGGLTASASSVFSTTEALALTVQGGAVAAPATQQPLGSMLINANGWVRITNSTLFVSGDVLVQSGGGIVADGTGSPAGQGSGAGRYFSLSGNNGYYGGGGGFGGFGGFGGTSSGGMPYDSAINPIAMGSGGGFYGGPPTGGAGGGAIRLSVGGTLTVNGRLSAEGTSSTLLNAGGGSGGSINLMVGALAGSGLISVNGAAGNALGGGGAGGRIAVVYTNSSYFAGTVRAWGGSGGAVGGAGTIYTKAGSQSVGQLVLDNAGASGPSSDIYSAGIVDLIIRGGAILSNYTSLPPVNNLLIASNSWLIPNKSGTFNLTVNGNATIQAGGGIKADGGGYAAGSGPGAGRNYSYYSGGLSGYVGSGGGYGGCGGAAAGGVGGAANGSALNGPLLGSGGAYGNTPSPPSLILGSAGGGSLVLRVTGILVLDGRLSADGLAGMLGSNSGGGSGGSVSVTAAAIMGAGTISACGGAGDGLGGGGGGGRIFLYPTVNAFVGSAVAYGGNGYARGGAGTVYTVVGQNAGQVVADNGGVPGTNTWLMDNGSFDLVVRGGALLAPTSSGLSLNNLSVASNSWVVYPISTTSYPLSVTLTITGNADLDAGGGIKADGAGYGAGAGTGAGRTYYLSSTYVGSGGAYGGGGGVGGIAGAWGGVPYGSAIGAPVPGSSGGNAPTSGSGGAGGAALNLRVTGSLNVDGKISANGLPGQGGNGGGGSGGSVYITAGVLQGSGIICANGGNGLGLGGGGGGGRVFLLPTVSAFSGQTTAYGGDGYARGGAGTIYTLVYSKTPGSLLVDNGGFPGTNTVLSDSGTFDLTLKGGAKGVIASSVFTIRDLYVGANGWLIPPSTPATLTISGSGVIEAGGGIIADGLGYPAGAGPGGGYSNSDGSRGGGGYGGFGGGNPRAGGAAYGSMQAPNQLGSGGAGYYVSGANPTNASAGGGAVLLNVAGTLDVEGRISANGMGGGSVVAGGGAGGSIWLTVGTLLGTGSIAANGGNGSGAAGGGGGGRIALVCGTNLFGGSSTAYGGTGATGNGGAGTIYIAPKNSQSTPQVIVDNGGLSGTNTSIPLVNSSTDLIIRNGAAVSASGTTALHNLLVLSNGWLKISGAFAPVTVAGNATIQSGGGLIADGGGSPAGQGPGAGRSLTSAWGTAGSGGGYGGNGASSATGAAGGAGYGSPTMAVNPGSGGGSGPDSAFGGAGGGVVMLTVKGTLQLDGRISADGAPGLAPGGGGGSGGSVSLSAMLFAGAGLVSANGGPGDGMGGGGGGGRITLQCNTRTFTGAVTAFGGTGAATGGAGTIYTSPLEQAAGVVLVDNGGQSGTNTPLFASGNFDLTIQDGAIASVSVPYVSWNNLFINAGGTLTAPPSQTNLDLLVLGNARIESGGALSLDGKGFAQALGPGAGLSSDSIGSGAGYGGVGGASSAVPGGAAYGSAQQPVDAGSGGGYGWGSPGSGSEGGGALRFSVAGALTVNGRLSANGNAALQEDGGGGSGGSLWIEASSLAGNGTISADGGQGEFLGGGGGAGGRIALYSHANTFAGQLSAAGAPGYAWGQDGTIYNSAAFGAPVVLSQNPAGSVSNSVALVDLAFSAPLDPGYCLGNSQSLLTAPDGTQYPMVVSAMLDSTHLRFSFPVQTTAGDYSLTVGPGLLGLFGLPMSQVYTGSFTISVPVIQGTITDLNGQPVPGVLLQSSTGFATATTDTNGNYVLSVGPGTDPTVTPTLGNLVFVPGAMAYTNVTSSFSNQNYMAVSSIVPTLTAQCSSSNLTMSWFGIPGVSYQALCSTNLVDWVPYGDVVVGTNGMVQLSVPTDADPVKFFRLRASN